MTIHDLQRACEAATKGPWKTEGTMVWSPNQKANIAKVSELRATSNVGFTDPQIGSNDLKELFANAAFIALSREAVPKLIAFVKAWDELEACCQDALAGVQELQEAEDKLAVARKALEE